MVKFYNEILTMLRLFPRHLWLVTLIIMYSVYWTVHSAYFKLLEVVIISHSSSIYINVMCTV